MFSFATLIYFKCKMISTAVLVNISTISRNCHFFFVVKTFKIYTLSNIFPPRFYLFICRERGREGGREEEKHQCVAASCTPPTGDMGHNPGMCPDWESIQ